ncbi:MAG: 1-(5-phosphoribosyl)-5-[(5-phosphoribosylamino)methylideneamino]imidazole-4-carboxamide isomerase [bacterium]|nr:1-(5-phosphoribosyl)-5-[(5-phosphoribosylamino)methylideneamino]imidazole-4-carboxamide isomerase [bacterium]
MELLPAIDLRDGKCVRLEQGDATRQTVYSDDPCAVARQFAAAGATWLHIVDLDGAFSGTRRHTQVVRAIVDATGLQVELGGGIRTLDDIAACRAAGARRVVLGTSAHGQPAFVRAAVQQFGDAIAVGIDARDGLVAVRGWTAPTQTPVLDFARAIVALGVVTLVYTDIATDGMLAGPDFATVQALLATLDATIIASGGVASLEHLDALTRLTPRAPDGCIIGKALYHGALDLRAALALTRARANRPTAPSLETTTHDVSKNVC